MTEHHKQIQKTRIITKTKKKEKSRNLYDIIKKHTEKYRNHTTTQK